ncbi:hypothetical protein AQ505_08410 [Pedobacter sp. PACM 27299]|uniref:hypothetical protein n=1 Tax=Pedobacter sp. PACM 27299 TaxID=1727164 RepID=UPI000705DBC8|nr:hypothetical protein [Pedobacter sp. PACM 27299]ALL05509.1 hypothetical protein AQ505_08410 [Pedobacter sp. PACM 27299]
MFSDYKEKVLGEYQKKRAESTLSINLLHPTPGKLKAECLIVYMERYLQKDDQTLRLFFGLKDQSTNYAQSIRNFENDKFKPLINFLNRRTNDTEDKNIALLAWLINFEPRPYKFGNSYALKSSAVSLDESTNNVINIENVDNLIEQEVTSTSPEIVKEKIEPKEIGQTISQTLIGKTPTPTKKVILNATLSVAAVAIALGAALLFMSPTEECMHWTGDHYERISCNQKASDYPIIALDTEKVAHLKKITLPDTITKNGIGRIWYAKIEGELEFYTADGIHPVYTDKRLKPLTDYILDKYLSSKKEVLQSP